MDNEKNIKEPETNESSSKSIGKTRVIIFSKPYTFECEQYKEIDLSRLDDLTTDDLLTAERIYIKAGGSALNPETSLLYSVILAHIASDVPLEFFGQLPAKESMKIKKEIFSFFYRGI